MVDIERTDENNKDFLDLVALLDRELAVRDGSEHGFYAQFNKPVGLEGVVVAYVENKPVGCGAYKKLDENTAEIKRMFVTPDSRGRRVGAAILNELEKMARESGFSSCVLETGKKQPEAITLYTREGYEKIQNYGQYIGVDNSVCMKKAFV